MHNIKFRAKNIVFVFFKVLGNEKLPILQLCNTDICLATYRSRKAGCAPVDKCLTKDDVVPAFSEIFTLQVLHFALATFFTSSTLKSSKPNCITSGNV